MYICFIFMITFKRLDQLILTLTKLLRISHYQSEHRLSLKKIINHKYNVHVKSDIPVHENHHLHITMSILR
jgi:hypothetical protein